MNRKIFLILFIITFFYPAAYCFGGVKSHINRGNLFYEKDEFARALEEYKKAYAKKAGSEIVNFDLGSALYKLGRYADAAGHFQKVLLSEDKSLRQKTGYNLGNSKYKYGVSKENTDLKSAVDSLEQAVSHYEKSLKLKPKDKDARHNLKIARKKLEQLKQKMKKQKSKTSKDKQKSGENKQEDKKPGGRGKEEEKKKDKSRQKKEKKAQGKEQQPEPDRGGEKGQDKAELSRQEEEQAPRPGQGREGKPGEMSEKEALMMLRRYSQEDEPDSLYKKKIPAAGSRKVLKDW